MVEVEVRGSLDPEEMRASTWGGEKGQGRKNMDLKKGSWFLG